MRRWGHLAQRGVQRNTANATSANTRPRGIAARRGHRGAHHARVARFLRDNQVDATAAHHVGAALAADADADTARPSWAFLAALGLIGGGPTFVGAAVGHGFTSEPVSVVFLTLAAGSILYVITQLITVGAKAKRTDLLAYGLLAGLLAGFATDAVGTVAGV